MKYCNACGMPLEQKEDFALGDENALYCCYCVNSDGSLRTCEEIFEGGVQFFIDQLKTDRQMAEKIVRKNMLNQPQWQDRMYAILQGDQATDEEFAEMMKKM